MTGADRGRAEWEAYLAGRSRVPPLYDPADRGAAFDPEDARHGTLYAYAHGCLCPWCRLAGVAYRDHRRLGIPLPRGFNAREQTSDRQDSQ